MPVARPSYECCLRALLVAVAAVTGCQKTIAPVSGRVTFNGKPLANATVSFQPRGTRDDPLPPGTGSVGHTNRDGRYSLRMVEPDQPGAVVGTHVVRISVSTGDRDAAESKASPLPYAWRDGSRQYRVPPGGTSKADFDIVATEPPPAKAKAKAKRPR
jgi:hypothetical protein